MQTKSKQAPPMNLRNRLARLESAVHRRRSDKVFPRFDNVASVDRNALGEALEAGYWLNLLARWEFALIFLCERINATQGKVIGKFCREVMETEQPKSKPWARAR